MTPLTATEAAALTERAQHAADTLAHLLTVLHDGEAWRVLEYPSWRKYCEAHFEPSLSTIYRMMRRDKAQEALEGHVILTRLNKGALEAFADVDADHIRAVADIAAASQTGRIGIQTVRSVQAAVAETLVTGAVTGADGELFRVADVMAAGVRDYEREGVNARREYLAANVEAQFIEQEGDRLYITAFVENNIPMKAGEYVRISIWRKPNDRH